MIPHHEFGKLRLAQFLPQSEITPIEDFEFMDHAWLGEAVGFSEWLRLEEDPTVLRSIALDFTHLPEAICTSVLEQLQLPLRRGMTSQELIAVLGPPGKTQRFVKDRETLSFAYGGPHSYSVSCTVLNTGGLTYLVVMAPYPNHGACA